MVTPSEAGHEPKAQSPESTRSSDTFTPDVDILELPEALVLRVDMPGVAPQCIQVDFEDGLLTLRGKVTKTLPQNVRFHLREYGLGDFVRSFRVGEAVDPSGIHAEYHNGEVTVKLPKAQQAKPRKIEIKIK